MLIKFNSNTLGCSFFRIQFYFLQGNLSFHTCVPEMYSLLILACLQDWLALPQLYNRKIISLWRALF